MTETEFQQANLDDLIKIFHDDTLAATASRILESARASCTEVSLPGLLGDNRDDTSGAFGHAPLDFLLAFYCIVEIACQIRYVPEHLPQEFANRAEWNLSRKAVERYSEQHSSLLLALFRRRLARKLNVYGETPSDPTDLHQLFSEFLGMINRLNSDESIRVFLWFIQGHSLDGCRAEDMLALLRRPREILERVLKSESSQDVLDLALRGFQSFLTLFLEFDDLMQHCQDYSALQSSQFHYFSHWFERIGSSIKECIGQAMQALLLSTSDANNLQETQASEDIKEYVQYVQGVVERVFCGVYGVALGDAVHDSMEDVRAQDLEQAISRHEMALRTADRETMPVAWSQTMLDLALAYLNRVHGAPSENLEHALQLYEQVLSQTDRNAMPVEWAQITADLANVYQHRDRGDRADNLEQAINLYQQALAAIKQEAMPIDWVATMIGLAEIYQHRIRGTRADNLKHARELCSALQEALGSHLRLATVLEAARQSLGHGTSRLADLLRRIYQYAPEDDSVRIWDLLDYDDVHFGLSGTCALYTNEEVAILHKNKREDRNLIELFETAKTASVLAEPVGFAVDLNRAARGSRRIQIAVA